MEWLLEGITLCFLGILLVIVAWLLGAGQLATNLVARACALMLIAMALVSAFTGARTTVLPMKLCPIVKTMAASFIIAGTI